MSDKLTNMTVRAFTGVLFVTIMVTCFFQPIAMVFLFALITCLSLWEYSGLVNNIEDVTINRFISTVTGVYLFLAISAVNSGFVQTNAVFMPYLLANYTLRTRMQFTTYPTPCWDKCMLLCPYL